MDQKLVRLAASSLGAVEDDRIPGLWHLPGHPELTSGQIVDLFGRMAQNVPVTDIAGSVMARAQEGRVLTPMESAVNQIFGRMF